MSGIRTAVAALAATVVAGGVLASAQQPARGTATPQRGSTTPAARGTTTAAPALAQVGSGQTPSSLPLSQTVRERGTSLTGSFEGWYHGKDGSDYAFLGYFNRNTKQELDIPVGPNNRIEPGGPDQGQPTHFLTGRQRGLFTVKLPKDLGTRKLAWTIVANGFTNVITIHTQADYIIEPYQLAGSSNTPPVLKFDPNGASFSGPPVGFATTLSASANTPLMLTTYVTGDQGRGFGGGGGGGAAPGAAPGGAAGAGGRGAAGRGGRGAAGAAAEPSANAGDQAAAAAPAGGAPQGRPGGRGGRGGAAGAAAGAGNPAAAAAAFGRGGGGGPTWTKYRGPGGVTFAAVPRPADAGPNTDGKAQTNATFDAPGDYVIRVQAGSANGEQCCWTTAHLKVTVK